MNKDYELKIIIEILRKNAEGYKKEIARLKAENKAHRQVAIDAMRELTMKTRETNT